MNPTAAPTAPSTMSQPQMFTARSSLLPLADTRTQATLALGYRIDAAPSTRTQPRLTARGLRHQLLRVQSGRPLTAPTYRECRQALLGLYHMPPSRPVEGPFDPARRHQERLPRSRLLVRRLVQGLLQRPPYPHLDCPPRPCRQPPPEPPRASAAFRPALPWLR